MVWSFFFTILPILPGSRTTSTRVNTILSIPAKCRMQCTEPDGKEVNFFFTDGTITVNNCFNDHGVINL